MILSCDFRKIESFDFKQIKSFDSDSKISKSNHLILILKFLNQNQMILSYGFRKIESFDFDFIFKDFKK